jgi:hypothetical protein
VQEERKLAQNDRPRPLGLELLAAFIDIGIEIAIEIEIAPLIAVDGLPLANDISGSLDGGSGSPSCRGLCRQPGQPDWRRIPVQTRARSRNTADGPS